MESSGVLPQAEEAFVVVGATATPMRREHPKGFFVARLADQTYRIRVKLYTGDVQEFEDPYRFHPY